MSAPPQNVNEWLNIATDDLCAVAKKRIRLEIESHFQEAVDAHRADGQTKDQAKILALQDLGDAEAWAKRFRKTHLTEDEATQLAKEWALYKNWNSGLRELALSYLPCVFGLALNYCLLRKYHVSVLLQALLSVPCLVAPVLSFFAIRRNPQPSLRLLVILRILYLCPLSLFFAYFGAWGWSILIFISPAIYLDLMRYVPLWLKIRKIDDF
jgi:hypothetical protein